MDCQVSQHRETETKTTKYEEKSPLVSSAAKLGASTTSKSRNEDLSYGWGMFRPSWLQWMNNITGVVLLMSIANCLQSMAAGQLGVVMSSIEKQFDLTSSQSAWIANGYQIGALPILIFCSLFGKR